MRMRVGPFVTMIVAQRCSGADAGGQQDHLQIHPSVQSIACPRRSGGSQNLMISLRLRSGRSGRDQPHLLQLQKHLMGAVIDFNILSIKTQFGGLGNVVRV